MKKINNVVLSGGLFVGGVAVGFKACQKILIAMLNDEKYVNENIKPAVRKVLEAMVDDTIRKEEKANE